MPLLLPRIVVPEAVKAPVTVNAVAVTGAPMAVAELMVKLLPALPRMVLPLTVTEPEVAQKQSLTAS